MDVKPYSKRWWKRWNSGAYDRVPVIRAAFLARLDTLAHAPDSTSPRTISSSRSRDGSVARP